MSQCQRYQGIKRADCHEDKDQLEEEQEEETGEIASPITTNEISKLIYGLFDQIQAVEAIE